MLRTKTHVLYGDWRRRKGTKTEPHLWHDGATSVDTLTRPRCGKRIPRCATVAVQSGEPCRDCLVTAITAR